jgi:hypothetical protein
MKWFVLIALACIAAAGCKKAHEDSSAGSGGAGPSEVRPGAGPGVMGVHGAVDREQLEVALDQIRLFIENASGPEGNMPSVQLTYETLRKEAPQYAKWVDEKLIVLNPAKTREEVWAYAVLPQGNYSVLTSTGIQPMTLQQLNQRLGTGGQ